MQTLASLILHGLLRSTPFYAPLSAPGCTLILCMPRPRRLQRDVQRSDRKNHVFDDKIRIFFKYTKTSPEDTPWEMPAYPGSDSSNMVDLRGLLRRNRFSARSPTPSCASCRLRRGDRVALLRHPSSLSPRAARSFVNSTTQNGKAFRLPVFVWWTVNP